MLDLEIKWAAIPVGIILLLFAGPYEHQMDYSRPPTETGKE